MKELKVTPPKGYIIDEEKSTIYNIVFKKKDKLPTSWEEFCKNYLRQSGECFIDSYSNIRTFIQEGNRSISVDKNSLPSKEAAEAHLALMQLHKLRDVYRQGWVPDYNNIFAIKYAVIYQKNVLTITETNTISSFLSFQSQEIAEQFLENFKDLINVAKELL